MKESITVRTTSNKETLEHFEMGKVLNRQDTSKICSWTLLCQKILLNTKFE